MAELLEAHRGHIPVDERCRQIKLRTISYCNYPPNAIEIVPTPTLLNLKHLLTHYQSLLFISTTLGILFTPVHLWTLWHTLDLENPPVHDCLEILQYVHGIQQDLNDQKWPNRDLLTVYVHGSSYMEDGTRYGEAAVVELGKTVLEFLLSSGTSAQRAEKRPH